MQSLWPSGLKISVRKKKRFGPLDSMTDSFDSGSITFRTAKQASEKDLLGFHNSPLPRRKTDRAKAGHTPSRKLARRGVRGGSGISLAGGTVLGSFCRPLPPHASRNIGSPRTGRHSHWHGRRHGRGRNGRARLFGGLPVLPVPMWMGGLWLVFGTSLPAFEPFLSKHFWLTPVLGIVGGVGAYTSAGTFGAVELGEAGRLTMVILVGLLWATAFPLLVHLAKRRNP